MTDHHATPLERLLLLQLGERLKRLRKAQHMDTVAFAALVGITRNTLRAVESGDPSPSMGTYLRVMSTLGVGGDLVLLASDVLQPAPVASVAARSRCAAPVAQVHVRSDSRQHQSQDLQSLVLHEEAVRLAKCDPALLDRALQTLHQWLATSDVRSARLLHEWEGILMARTWRKVLGHTQRAQELRQASPLVTVLPKDTRQTILNQMGELKAGIELGGGSEQLR